MAVLQSTSHDAQEVHLPVVAVLNLLLYFFVVFNQLL